MSISPAPVRVLWCCNIQRMSPASRWSFHREKIPCPILRARLSSRFLSCQKICALYTLSNQCFHHKKYTKYKLKHHFEAMKAVETPGELLSETKQRSLIAKNTFSEPRICWFITQRPYWKAFEFSGILFLITCSEYKHGINMTCLFC